MQFIVKNLLSFVLLLIPALVFSQSTYLPQGNKHQALMDRLEIKLQTNPDLNLFTIKPLLRNKAVAAGLQADSLQKTKPGFLSSVDQFNLNSLYRQNSEWYNGDPVLLKSKKPFLKHFYQTAANLVEVKEKDFFLVINPVIQQQQGAESGYKERVFLNSKGLTARGIIGNKIGFSAYITDNQERGPRFVQTRIDSADAVPGAGFYKAFKVTAKDYFDARGSIHFNATKYLNFSFGYDKQFIGNGYRSLFLSEYANSALFLKVNTRIWKFNYMNLFMELTPQTVQISAGDKLLDKKYVAMHHLSFNATPWLNLGLFEAVVFGRKNHFDFTYLNPIMFLRVSEQQNGSADNALVGFDFKANVAKRAQFYGQFLLDEFFLKEVRAQNGWWANKFGLQLGAKYIDLFNVKNLDVHGEINLVRPFTYSHYDSVSNYTHFNQPLAHPLGANFAEMIGVVRYQPFPRWTAEARLIVWKQGLDSLGVNSNYGSDIFKVNTNRPAGDYGYKIGSGIAANAVNAQLWVSYEWKENLYLEGGLLYRKQSKPVGAASVPDATVMSLGLRWNAWRRTYDY